MLEAKIEVVEFANYALPGDGSTVPSNVEAD